jgi:tetratricopeptide (TPR) repeat protein
VGRNTDMVFLAAIDPPLRDGDLAWVLARLRGNWPPERLVELLASPSSSVSRTAATCLGLTGSMDHCERLVPLLGHSDEQVVSAAEDALWNLWMRAGSKEGTVRLQAAIERLQQNDAESALRILHDLTTTEESLAEAHHQRAIALHSLERLDEAESAYKETLALNPYHFAAAAALGHVCVQRGDCTGALRYYRRALRIHPQLAEVREIVPPLEAAIKRRVVA